MIKSEFNGIKVAGIMTAVPKQKDIIEKNLGDTFGEEAVKQFSKMTGVKERRLSEDEQTASDLAFVAADTLLNVKKIDRDTVGVVVFVTQTPDYNVPATACVLHKRLALSKNCMAFDVNLGCSGYVYGMQIASSILQSCNCKYALLLVGDTSQRTISPDDKSAVMLFGEAGAAILLEKDRSASIMRTGLRSDGNGFKAIIIPGGRARNKDASKERIVWPVDDCKRSDCDLYMNGIDVFTFTISEVPSLIKEYLVENNVNREDYDAFVFHQANAYIIKQITKLVKLPKDKVPISIDRFGNTSVTSIPLTICDAYGNENENRDLKLFTCGFGIGLSWGIADFEVNTNDIYPIIETEDYFKDGGVSHD